MREVMPYEVVMPYEGGHAIFGRPCYIREVDRLKHREEQLKLVQQPSLRQPRLPLLLHQRHPFHPVSR